MPEITRTEAQEPQDTWTIEKGKSFAYRFVDPQGRERGRFKDADAMATHFVFAIQRIERLAEALRDLHDEQNGPPLSTREKQWREAYKKAGEVLKEWEASHV